MSAPKVSIIIPTYNYGHYIGEAIDSALAQKGVEVEIIAVDDGSTDNTREVCEGYGDKVRYLSQENSGPSAARNLGLKNAQSPYILFLDADDILCPDMLPTLFSKFEELGGEFAVVSCLNQHVDDSGKSRENPFKSSLSGEGREIQASDLLIKNYFNPSAALIRKEALDDVNGFDATLMSSEERDLWLRIAMKHRIYLLNEPLIKLRVHSGSYSNNAERMYESMKRTIANGLRIGGQQFTLLQKQKARSYCEFEGFWMYLGERQRIKAAIRLLWSWLFLPWFPDITALGYKPGFRVRAVRHLFGSLLKA